MGAEEGTIAMRPANRTIHWLVIGLIVANLGSLAFMWWERIGPAPRGDRPHDPERVFAFIAGGVGMTPEQRARYRELRDEHRRAMRPLLEEQRRLRERFFARLGAPQVEDSATAREARAISDVGSRIEAVTFNHFRGVRGMLTQEQRTRFDGIIQEALRMMAPRPHGP